MIALEKVSFSINGRSILKDVSFVVPSGAITAILGESGSGKTTILRLILGLVKPDSGRVIVDGEDITDFTEQQLAGVRKKIGMVFQEGALFDSMTVGENVAFSMWEQTSMSQAEIVQRVERLLGFVGLEEAIDMVPAELSGGMRRRAAIARAFGVCEPRIMLYDEPTTGLDPPNAANIAELIVKMRDIIQVTSIVVTHQLRDVFKMAKQFLMLHEGEMIFEGTQKDLEGSSHLLIQQFLR